ncbi:Putative oxidoreductase [Olavius sp. associated proteobacterium Delta 1]|nr:Putative oxidoreductase [Olavius sp. associated proteobacterium Delta 1]
MASAYNKTRARNFIKHYPNIAKEMALRTYTSRLIGADPNLVLHGGGNTSVKLKHKNILGEDQEILFIKGSGVDLATIEPERFVALDLTFLKKFRRLDKLEDAEMENQLQICKLLPSALSPSVESFLHAFLPHRYVDHCHADSILILTSQPNGPDMVRDVLGPRVAALPYCMSGLPLAKKVASAYDQNPDLEAIVIGNHGIFTFGEDAATSYTRMIDCVNRAAAFIKSKIKGHAWVTPREDLTPFEESKPLAAVFAPSIRGACAHPGPDGRLCRFRVEFRSTPDLVDASLSREAPTLCDSGVLTPDHVTYTKNRYAYIRWLPDQVDDLAVTLRREIDKFVAEYHRYFKEHAGLDGRERQESDPFPRVFLVPGLGVFALGLSRREAGAAADIAEHTIRAKLQAGAIGAYVPIADSHIFEMEYWRLQQKKVPKRPRPLLQGQIALITGGGGAIGCGIADRLLAAGAAVVLSDIDESRLQKVGVVLKDRYPAGEIESIPIDVTDYPSVTSAYEEISRRLGGIDIVVPNAGIAHVARIEDLDPQKLDQVIDVNFKGTFNTIKAAIPVFKRQGTGGNVVVISSKNVFDPGAAFGAYSASKAGAHQISKIAALELAPLGVRVNMINPDAVFGDENISSKLWDLVGPDRMKSRGLDYEGLKAYYQNRNLLKAEVQAEHVGNAVVFFASDQTPTTGASLPVDGGIAAAFPR